MMETPLVQEIPESELSWSSFESTSAVMADSHCMRVTLGVPMGCVILVWSRDREWDIFVLGSRFLCNVNIVGLSS